MKAHFKLLTATALALGAGMAHAASLTGAGYSESFDGMGTAGTAPPSGFSIFNGPGSTGNSTWTTSIPGNGSGSVASMVAAAGSLTATSSPTSNNNNGYNAAISPGNTSDRVLATAPTGNSGTALQLLLTNNTGSAFDQLSVSYDTVRFTSVSSANELPGYWLFYSLDGSSWSNASSLNPTAATVPNSVGVTSVGNAVFSLGASVNAGQDMYLRWVDDNAVQTSPDQIFGLNNLAVAAVPEPGTYALMLAGLGLVGFAARRRTRR